MSTIVLLHPGAMGVTVGAALRASGHDVRWHSARRSDETRQRAQRAGLSECGHLAEALDGADGVISVCPPHAALDLARDIEAHGYGALYVDANAVSPETACAIQDVIGPAFIDGGIIGPPATREGSTRLYLSGPRASEVVGWFSAGLLGVDIVSDRPGDASALKICYAAYTKGSSALLLAVRALAEANGVSGSLLKEWGISQPGLMDRSEGAARGTALKAWRFVGEMLEIASTFENARLPGGFHRAAAEVYKRMAPLKETDAAGIVEVLNALNAQAEG
ncbi:MAG: DUF1932 domain-containing protein [Pseudomonadales bacterium]|nr:DUF1932 domain-containing protein [Pseudomonadales bacterium]MDP6471866.1 DUF1932 domain-containing protein [Pseudomonadales bacterium]MDP6826864.1 DUF1932 domain-containing protein [Pseudomonadales bacterium]MDP6970858.1 DUF1932 domain-containing protein [Pseudomonadales bacterium]